MTAAFHPLTNTPVLTTARLRLRVPVPSDMAPWMAFLVSPRGTWHGGGPEHGPGRAWRIIATLIGHWSIHGFGIFIAEDRTTGRPLAAVGAFFPANWPERELGWSVWAQADEGRGYAAEAATEILRHCAHDLGWSPLLSYIDPENARSVALAERLGAVREPGTPTPHPDDVAFRHKVAP